MKTFSILVISGLLMISIGYAQVEKTYKHAEEYQVGVVDQDVQAVTGTDATISSTSTDAKLSGGGEGIHILHTEAGTYRVEAPTNSGLTVLAALGNNNRYGPAPHHPQQLVP